MAPKDKGKIPGSPAEWMSHAESDLRLARLAAGDQQVRREQACFHLQQAAEKAIKAVLLARRVDFPLTHDIEQLLEIAEESGLDLPEDVRESGMLSPYAVETRYPGSWFEISADDLQQAMRVAEATVCWANSTLKGLQGADL
jgi:HEPN domain-containing protein